MQGAERQCGEGALVSLHITRSMAPCVAQGNGDS